MKKLLIFAILAAFVASVEANCFRRGRCGAKSACHTKCATKPRCVKTIVNEGPMPTRCCKKLIEVQEAPILTKHVDISWTCECPETCNEIVGEVVYKDGEEGKSHVINGEGFRK